MADTRGERLIESTEHLIFDGSESVPYVIEEPLFTRIRVSILDMRF